MTNTRETGEKPNVDETQTSAAKIQTVQAGSQGPTVAGLVGLNRLCRDCRWFQRFGKDCSQPSLPLNLVDGRRRFPAFVARGYDALCGASGRFWEAR